jgi:hypothetical protein
MSGLTDASEELERLAVLTRGLDSVDFARTADRYLRDGSLPARPGACPPIDIDKDEYCEGDTNVAEILRLLRQAGFAAHAYPAMLESRRSRYLQPLARTIPGFFFASHLFDDSTVFIGQKPRV